MTLSLFDAPVRSVQSLEECQCGAERIAECTCWPPAPHPLAGLVAEHFPTAPHNHTETSKAASAHVLATGQAATQLAQVLSLIEQAGQEGLTRGDIAHALGLPTSTICARVDTLRKAGRVQEDGRTRIPKCGGHVKQRVLVGVGI